jgi:hypothetical protein
MRSRAVLLATALLTLPACQRDDHRLSPDPVDLVQDLQSSSLDTNAATALDGLDLDQVVAFRLDRVRRYAQTGIFPPSYHPLRGTSSSIYTPITPKANWLGPTPYYVANPYVLIVLVVADRVTPLNLMCPEVSLRYAAGTITEKRSGDSAACWFRWLYEPGYASSPGAVRLVMVNAFDAGYRFAHVDLARSANLRDEGEPDNVLRGAFSQPSLFHYGQYRKNNISPRDPRGWVRLAERGRATRIHVKLWRDAPGRSSEPADLTYEALVEP